MIVEALVGLFRTVVTAVLGLLPERSVDAWSVPNLSVPWSIASDVFPTGQFVVAVGVLLGWTVVCHGYRIVLWILGLLHIAGNAEG